MDQETIRELNQLWFVSKKYFELALGEKQEIPQTALEWTVKILADKCRTLSGLSDNKNLIYFSAHLNSCAVRLYSIDENLKSNRWNRYNKLKKCKDVQIIRHEIMKNLDVYIHFLLRHIVAHSESRRKRNSQFRTAFEAMYDIVLDLGFDSIFKSMETLIRSIENDLRTVSIRM